MFEPFKLTSWAMAKEDCPIQYSVTGSDEVLFVFGSGRDSFEFAFDAGALQSDRSAPHKRQLALWGGLPTRVVR